MMFFRSKVISVLYNCFNFGFTQLLLMRGYQGLVGHYERISSKKNTNSTMPLVRYIKFFCLFVSPLSDLFMCAERQMISAAAYGVTVFTKMVT